MSRLTGAAKTAHERKVILDAARKAVQSRRPGSAHDAAVLIRAAAHAGAHHTCGNSHNDPGDCLACEREDGPVSKPHAGVLAKTKEVDD
jgi:hypothetical protein